jgi:hypothetical protein
LERFKKEEEYVEIVGAYHLFNHSLFPLGLKTTRTVLVYYDLLSKMDKMKYNTTNNKLIPHAR